MTLFTMMTMVTMVAMMTMVTMMIIMTMVTVMIVTLTMLKVSTEPLEPWDGYVWRSSGDRRGVDTINLI